jgi:hypothetical protein
MSMENQDKKETKGGPCVARPSFTVKGEDIGVFRLLGLKVHWAIPGNPKSIPPERLFIPVLEQGSGK